MWWNSLPFSIEWSMLINLSWDILWEYDNSLMWIMCKSMCYLHFEYFMLFLYLVTAIEQILLKYLSNRMSCKFDSVEWCNMWGLQFQLQNMLRFNQRLYQLRSIKSIIFWYKKMSWLLSIKHSYLIWQHVLSMWFKLSNLLWNTYKLYNMHQRPCSSHELDLLSIMRSSSICWQ